MTRLKWRGWLPILSGLMILLLSGSCSLRAQKRQKQDIRDNYEEVNVRIDRCEDEGSPCGLYLNRIQTNPGDEPWAVVGVYQSTRDLWYKRNESSEEERFQLIKVNSKTHRSSRLENEEYLFAPEGQLEFYYFRLEDAGDVLQEYRYYFSGGKLIDYVEQLGAEEEEYREWSKEDASKVQERATELQELLQATI